MKVLFDSSALLLTLYPKASPPLDPSTNAPLGHAKQRVDYLIRKLSKERASVIVPTPVLSEVLVYANAAAPEYIQKLQQSPFKVVPFDSRAALECAEAIRKFGAKGKGPSNPRAKVKFDRQIVAIAKVEGVECIYSDDGDIFTYANAAKIKVIRSFEMELDPEDRQKKLDLAT